MTLLTAAFKLRKGPLFISCMSVEEFPPFTALSAFTVRSVQATKHIVGEYLASRSMI